LNSEFKGRRRGSLSGDGMVYCVHVANPQASGHMSAGKFIAGFSKGGY